MRKFSLAPATISKTLIAPLLVFSTGCDSSSGNSDGSPAGASTSESSVVSVPSPNQPGGSNEPPSSSPTSSPVGTEPPSGSGSPSSTPVNGSPTGAPSPTPSSTPTTTPITTPTGPENTGSPTPAASIPGTNTGGNGGTGENPNAGGGPAAGSGGQQNTGGDQNTGGEQNTAGTSPGGNPNAAGNNGTAGNGNAGNGNTEPPTPGNACAVTPDRIRITEIDVGTTVLNDENEAALRPLAISAIPSGGSRLAWMGNDGQAHIVTLDSNDQISGPRLSVEAKTFGDVYADNGGGVVLVTRPAHGSGERYCGALTNLCGNVNSLPAQYECWDMYMVRFDGSNETWATQISESAPDNPPYMSGPTASGRIVYIWQAYAHHGRLASDGTNFAGYFGAAISLSENCVQPDTSQPRGVNIHQGDRMQVVGPTGELLSGRNSFGWGCSHSGYEKVLWDPRAERFLSVCKTDNNNRISLAAPYSTIRPIDLAANNLSDVVLADGDGYWLLASDAEPGGGGNADVLLLRFSVSGNSATLADEIVVAGTPGLNERAPYLAHYGTDGLLAGWETGSNTNDLRRNDASRRMYVQARDRATGAAIGEPVQADVLGNRYQAFRPYPDGSVAFPAPGTSNTQIKILRVLPCE